MLYNYRLPKLTLQPIVENAIFHGIERKVGKGSIRIKVEATEMRLIITVSDDGLGIEPERLRELTEKLGKPAFDYVKPDGEKKGGIAIVNVNNRILPALPGRSTASTSSARSASAPTWRSTCRASPTT